MATVQQYGCAKYGPLLHGIDTSPKKILVFFDFVAASLREREGKEKDGRKPSKVGIVHQNCLSSASSVNFW